MMTVGDLIAELQRQPPGKPVRVCTRTCTGADEGGDYELWLTEEDAQDANEVRNEGGFVLIWGGRP